MNPKTAKTVRVAVDYGVPIAFLATLLITRDFQKATWVLVVASAVALLVGWIAERRLAPMPLFAGGSALVFGGLSLALHDKSLIKIKFTFVEGALALLMFGGLVLKRNPLKGLMGDALQLPDEAWRTLTIRYGLFFLTCAVANEFVWRTQSDGVWGGFKLACLGAAVVFSLAQAPFLMKHTLDKAEPDSLEPPDPGF